MAVNPTAKQKQPNFAYNGVKDGLDVFSHQKGVSCPICDKMSVEQIRTFVSDLRAANSF